MKLCVGHLEIMAITWVPTPPFLTLSAHVATFLSGGAGLTPCLQLPSTDVSCSLHFYHSHCSLGCISPSQIPRTPGGLSLATHCLVLEAFSNIVATFCDPVTFRTLHVCKAITMWAVLFHSASSDPTDRVAPVCLRGWTLENTSLGNCFQAGSPFNWFAVQAFYFKITSFSQAGTFDGWKVALKAPCLFFQYKVKVIYWFIFLCDRCLCVLVCELYTYTFLWQKNRGSSGGHRVGCLLPSVSIFNFFFSSFFYFLPSVLPSSFLSSFETVYQSVLELTM